MTNGACKPKDIADLFLKFGGDPHAYQEFKPLVEAHQKTDQWPLATPSAEMLPIGPVRIEAIQAARPQNAPAVQGSPAGEEIPRELDAFFVRLADELASPPTIAHGLLSQWRR